MKNKMKTRSLILNFKYLVAGATIGFVSWGHTPVFVCLSVLLYVLYFYAPTRTNFFIAAVGYYLATSRGLLEGITIYYKNFLYGFGIWLAAGLIISTAWILFWGNSPRTKSITFILANILIIVPPIGLVGWSNPILSTGLFLPGFGFFGVAIFIVGNILINTCVMWQKRLFSIAVILLCVLALNHNFTPINNLKIAQTNTKFGELYDDKKLDYIANFQLQNKYLSKVYKTKNDYVLLPENAVGNWNESNMMVWADLNAHKTVLAGASIQNKKNPKLSDNVLLQIKKSGYEVLYRQRVPVLISMWRPWEDRGTNAYLFYQNPVINIEGLGNSGILICYEQLLVYTLFETMFYEPDQIIAISNLWWASGTSIKKIEIASLELVSVLFGVPLSLSLNE